VRARRRRPVRRSRPSTPRTRPTDPTRRGSNSPLPAPVETAVDVEAAVPFAYALEADGQK
ncbi:hypothetical protein ACFQE1_17335, partial [Halobium palmae]